MSNVSLESAKRIYFRGNSSFESSSETESSGNYRLPKEFSTTSSDGWESDVSSPKVVRNRTKSPRRTIKTEPGGRYWSDELSARSNQDNQREYEERVMKQIVQMVDLKMDTESSSTPSNGGIFTILEAEWRERQRQLKTRNSVRQ